MGGNGRSFLLVLLLASCFVVPTGMASGQWSRIEAWLSRHVTQSEPQLTVQISVSPEASTPGQTIMLEMVLANSKLQSIMPKVDVALPASVSFALQDLTSGTTVDLQANRLGWQPFLPALGGSARLVIPLEVQVADVAKPEQQIVVLVEDDTYTERFETDFWVGLSPEARISLRPATVSVGQPLKLVADLSGSGPFSLVWSLGDGRTVEALEPTVVYPSAGSFEVTLQASNPVGQVFASSSVSVIPEPAADFAVVESSLTAGQPVEFANQSGGQPPLSFRWEFGDGAISSEPNPVHRFAEPGTYKVTLEVGNEQGSVSTTQTLVIAPPGSQELLLPDVVTAGQTVSGQLLTSSPYDQLLWDMGNGHTIEGASISYVYWSEGDYLVTVSGVAGRELLEVSKWIRVEPGRFDLSLPLVIRAAGRNRLPEGGNAVRSIGTEGVNSDIEIRLEPLDLPASTPPAEQLLAYINEARRLNDVPVLQQVDVLSLAAQQHAEDMALQAFNGHTGSDGTLPVHRIYRAGYTGGYGGEATAWGMQFANEPVEFWLASTAHRTIILNPDVTEVGVGYAVDFNAPSVWYWTAEFASPSLPAAELPPLLTAGGPSSDPEPILQLLGPPRDSGFVLDEDNLLIFSWEWSPPLQENERFGVYLKSSTRSYAIGLVRETSPSGVYQFRIAARQVPASPGQYQWQVRLENPLEDTATLETDFWPIRFWVTDEPPAEPGQRVEEG